MKITNYPLSGVIIALLSAVLCCSTALAETQPASPIKQTRIHFQSLLKQKPGFYPTCKVAPVPVPIKKEAFAKTYLSLSGLTGVHLDVDGLIKSAGAKKANLVGDLKAKIQQKLAKGGMRLLSKREMEKTPGQPEMSMFPSFPAHLSRAKKGEKPVVYRPDCCTMGIWTSFSQAARIMRDPDTHYKLGTWGEGHNTTDCSDPASWMSNVILKTVDNFVIKKLQAEKDYAALMKKRKKSKLSPKTQKLKQEINRELAKLQQETKPSRAAAVQKTPPKAIPKAPKIIREAATHSAPAPLMQTVQYPQQPVPLYQLQLQPLYQPYQSHQQYQPQPVYQPQLMYTAPMAYQAAPQIQCSNAVQTYIDLFATNQVHIDSKHYYVLDQLAMTMRSCPMYNYIIETHADPRSSFEHNERLSAMRAASMQGHLLARGIDQRQFVIQSFGEIKPASLGSSALDHAANRRVVIRPYLRQ